MADEATVRQSEFLAKLVAVRKRAGLTQQQLAEALGCTQGKINKIETGKIKIKRQDLEALLEVCNVPPEAAAEIKAMAIYSGPTASSGWAYSAAYTRLMALEGQAIEILALASERLPRILQADAYVLKQFECAGMLHDPSSLLLEKAARTEMFRKQPPLRYRCLLSESSLRRLPGGLEPALVIDQATHLLGLMASHEHVSIQILIYAAAIPWLDPDFTILKFDGSQRDLVYAEFATEGRLHRPAKLVADREEYWHQLQKAALSRDDTRAWLEDLIKQAEAGWQPLPVT
ncbi:helix-turn-helix domain-containing protein [Kibdelosporangium aridum]|uniref:Helix-turn-helix domain-containing protein n=1 Tax=Kibdelosporangium aridum TaxID=2030 RepID=A0A1W2EZV9_KIBAR|nr:helix-turn-helix transcriptional regulator [Kibdelosporangium aridum]SMD14758.1 Helix-turn-helix domain-containing protein [Kibdelosporangium aridum]